MSNNLNEMKKKIRNEGHLAFKSLRVVSDKEPDGTVYTDRLYQRDHEKHDRLCEKHFGDTGQIWRDRSAEDIEAFLCDWFDKEVEVVKIEEKKHQARGFYLWRIDYAEV